MVLSAAVDRYNNNRRDEKVTYILRSPEKRHRFGISSLVVGKHELFSAGRDGTVRAWTHPNLDTPNLHTLEQSDTEPHCVKSFDEHVDWVNDIIVIPGYERLVSCSSDTTLKVWNVNDPSRSLRTLAAHTDYVKALARARNAVASGSLDGRIYVWDLVTGRIAVELSDYANQHFSSPKSGPNHMNNKHLSSSMHQNNNANTDDIHRNSSFVGPASDSSIYCMSGNEDGNVLVSGSTDRTISVWDVRVGDRVVSLRGHQDSVRCVNLKHDASLLLSGGTDATVKLWDMRQQRCIRSYDSYAGSVWALAPNRELSAFLSGCRDGAVWHTDIDSSVVSVVVPVADPDPRSNMVLDVALSPCRSAAWVSTTGSAVRLWPLADDVCVAMGGKPNQYRNYFGAENRKGDDVDMKEVGSQEKQKSQDPDQDQTNPRPLYTIPGLPGIIAHRIMNDRRHVLTCNTRSEYNIWDITRGVLEKSLGIIEETDIDAVLKEHDIEVSVPSWFQVDIRLGSLLVRLEKSSVANAELYAVDAGLDAASEEIKVNVGEHVVIGLFRRWLEKYKERENGLDGDNHTNPNNEHNGDDKNNSTAPSSFKNTSGTNNPNNSTTYASGANSSNTSRAPPSTSTSAANSNANANAPRTTANRTAELPQYVFPPHIPVIITVDQSPVPEIRKTVGGFTGSEENLLPRWVVDLVRDGHGQVREVVKISFSLDPADDSGLPTLSTATLNAPRVLRVRKVSTYVARELKDSRHNLNFDIEAEHLEILCNGQVLPPTMSLATVRQFKWRSPDDLQLHYRLKSN